MTTFLRFACFVVFSFFFLPATARAATLDAPDSLAMEDGTYTSDRTPTFTWDPSDGATWYDVAVDESEFIGIGNVFTYTSSTLSDGWHTFFVRAHAGNSTSHSASMTFEVETHSLTVPRVSPSSATEDEEVTLRVSPSGTNDVRWCDLYVEDDNVGSMTEYDANDFGLDYTFSRDGSYTVYAACGDSQGYIVYGTSRTITVSESVSDSFSVPAVTPSTATEDETTTISVEPYGNDDVLWCDLYVSGSNVGAMTRGHDDTFSKHYTFTRTGNYTVYAYCTSDDGESVRGTSRTITVSAASSHTTSVGKLIKTTCTTRTSNTCRVVYYYADDGKRHAFPNESVYYSWYTTFEHVTEISESSMASIPIGDNVTYHPGSVLVQFESGSDIYAVKKSHTLMRYTGSSLLLSDYGSAWEDYVVEVPDTFYRNYTIGSEIDSTGDYDRGDAWESVNSLNDLF